MTVSQLHTSLICGYFFLVSEASILRSDCRASRNLEAFSGLLPTATTVLAIVDIATVACVLLDRHDFQYQRHNDSLLDREVRRHGVQPSSGGDRIDTLCHADCCRQRYQRTDGDGPSESPSRNRRVCDHIEQAANTYKTRIVTISLTDNFRLCAQDSRSYD